MKPIRVLTLLLALALLVGAAPPARTAEPLNVLNDADATERPPFDFASLGLALRLGSGQARDGQDRLLSGFSGSLASSVIQSPAAGDWHVECVDCPTKVNEATPMSHSLQGGHLKCTGTYH